MTIEFHQGDSNEILARLIASGRRVHSVITDPPYYLESVAKRFGKKGAAAAKAGSDGRFSRQSKGFMGRTWDGADEEGYRIAHDPAFWRKCFDMLLPGGFCLAFSSPRTGHWQAVAMEKAGFIMHPFIGWAYGSGFPKAHAVTRGAPKAVEWDGWYYGTQTLKPALEPIYVAQRPFSTKTGFANVLENGVGAFNIKDSMVPTGDDLNGGAYAKQGSARNDEWGASNGYRRDKGLEFVQPEGRWPANLIHDGSAEVASWFPDSKGQLSPSLSRQDAAAAAKTCRVYGTMQRERESKAPRGDSGSAARFFHAFPFEDHLVIYCAKPNAKEKIGTTHPTVKPQRLLRHLARLVTPVGGFVLDPFAGSGSMGLAALDEGMRPILIEREPDHADEIRRRFDLPVVDALLAQQYLAAILSTKASHETRELI